jgi:von Willebrand factor A domain-containing protein 8
VSSSRYCPGTRSDPRLPAELGRPQLKPKRIRFVVDVSASMYRNQYDGRLARSLEASELTLQAILHPRREAELTCLASSVTMVLESFSRLQRKEKYRIDIVGHSGEEAVIPLVPLDSLAGLHAGDFYK